jgi:hypothetical protein
LHKISKILAFAVITSPLALNSIPHIPESAIAQYPCWGILRESENGFVYLDLDDAYIHELIHFIEDDGFEEPPYFGKPGLIGAHISVVYPNEERSEGTIELGQMIQFTPLECKIIHPLKWEGVEEVYLIEVDAPELDLIRAKYGLPKAEFGYHITVGVK